MIFVPMLQVQFWALANATARGIHGEVLEILAIKDENHIKVRRWTLLSKDYRRPHTLHTKSCYPPDDRQGRPPTTKNEFTIAIQIEIQKKSFAHHSLRIGPSIWNDNREKRTVDKRSTISAQTITVSIETNNKASMVPLSFSLPEKRTSRYGR
jgi:hypothetical protein